MNLFKNRTLLLPAGLAVVYVAGLALVISLRSAPVIGLETDGVYYMIAARALFTKDFVPSTFGGGIGMPLSIAAVNLIVSDTFRSAQFVSALAGLIFLIAAVRIFTGVYSLGLGMITGALLLVSPVLVLNSATSLTDVLGACLPLAALWLLFAEKRSSRWWGALGGGILLGAAYAVRSVNVLFFPIGLVAVAQNGWRKSARRMAIVAGGLVLGALPQLYVNQKYFGNPFYSDNWRNIAALVFDWDSVNRLRSFSEALRQAGPTLIGIWIKRFVVEVPLALYHIVYLPLLFSVPGVFLLVSRTRGLPRRLIITWAICTVGYLFLIAGIWRIEPRYFLPTLPLLLAGASIMWQHLTRHSKPMFAGGLALAILMSAGVAVRDNRQFIRAQSTEFKEAGLFLRSEPSGEGVILASQPSVFFYARRPGMLIENVPKDELEKLDLVVALRKVDWIVFDERRGYRDHPNLGWLLDPNSKAAAEQGWQPVFVHNSPRIVAWRTHSPLQAGIR
jgi:hypothetical protein